MPGQRKAAPISRRGRPSAPALGSSRERPGRNHLSGAISSWFASFKNENGLRSRDGFFLFLLLGFLYGVAGFLTIQNPRLAAEGLTLMFAALFLVVGLFRIAVALVDHVPSWGWLLFNGVVTVLLGLAMWRQWPESGLWVVGTLVGIELIVNGVTWSVLAVGVAKGVAKLSGQ